MSLLFLGAACLGQGQEFDNTWHVDTDVSSSGTGEEWSEAFKTLQEALTAARNLPDDSHLIKVAQGTYVPGTSRSDSFDLPRDTKLEGGYIGHDAPDPDQRDIALYETILSGDINGDDQANFVNYADNCYNVVTVSDLIILPPELDGFTVLGGFANDPLDENRRTGAGILIGTHDGPTAGTTAIIRNC